MNPFKRLKLVFILTFKVWVLWQIAKRSEDVEFLQALMVKMEKLHEEVKHLVYYKKTNNEQY